jgi:hypothetical protein
MELVVALALAIAGAIVIIDSHRVGIGWGDDGLVRLLPNMIGWILTGASLDCRRSAVPVKAPGKVFVTRDELKR